MSEWRVASPDLGQMTAWRQMRQALWPEMTEEENLRETEAMMTATSRFFVRIALNREDKPVGFVEATVRNDYVNGCATSPVVFLEGIYVEPRERRQGAARALADAVRNGAGRWTVVNLHRMRCLRTAIVTQCIVRLGLRRRNEWCTSGRIC